MSHINRNLWRLPRRTFLRGAGISLALPLLNCMTRSRKRSRAGLPITVDTTAATEPPRRCVFIYLPNGVNTLSWQIRRAGVDYQLTEPLQALERHRSDITPISGLHHPGGLGQQHECDKIWLTGARLDRGNGRFRNSISADQLMAEVVGHHTRHASLQLAVTGGTLAWSQAGVPLPAERRPKAIFRRLFGVQDEGVSEARSVLRRHGSVLDLVIDDARRLRRAAGSEDRGKLDEYLHAVREVERRTEWAERWLETPKPTVTDEARERLSRDIPQAAAGTYHDVMYELMALALRTDQTRVITCMLGNEHRALALPEIGIDQTRHELSHHNGDPEKMARLTRCDTFLTERFAGFLDRLRAVDEQGESLLSRTMVLYGSGMSYGHGHGNANLPLLLAGGQSLGLRHGRHLDFNLPKIGQYDLENPRAHYALCLRPADDRARMSNLLLTMLGRMGVPVRSFADSLGTIPEIVR